MCSAPLLPFTRRHCHFHSFGIIFVFFTTRIDVAQTYSSPPRSVSRLSIFSSHLISSHLILFSWRRIKLAQRVQIAEPESAFLSSRFFFSLVCAALPLLPPSLPFLLLLLLLLMIHFTIYVLVCLLNTAKCKALARSTYRVHTPCARCAICLMKRCRRYALFHEGCIFLVVRTCVCAVCTLYGCE